MFHMQSDNIATMETAVKEAANEGGADMIALPECWNGPYSVRFEVRIKTISCSETLLDYWILCMDCEILNMYIYHFGSRETTSFKRIYNDRVICFGGCLLQ